MRLRNPGDGREFTVELLSHDNNSAKVRIDGREVHAAIDPLPDGGAMLSVGAGRMRIYAMRRGDSILIAIGPYQFELIVLEGRAARAAHQFAAPEVVAPMPGKVLEVLVKEGDQVEAGQPLLVMEAMKMETTLAAEGRAVVGKVRVAAGQMVGHGDVLIELTPAASPSPSESAPPDP
ncbi:MAG: acetyl-CoA carboxylase biotin carboxyl carrier protein subunit [Candidatus Binatales bacterium]